MTMNYVSEISIDVNSVVRGEHNSRERDLVITDLLEKNSIYPSGGNLSGPFSLFIAIVQNKILLTFEGSCGKKEEIEISLMPMRRIIKDYSIICASYFDAIKYADIRKVEAIDMGRRSVHDEGAAILQQQLGDEIKIDFNTARKLFSLIYLLQEK